MKKSIMFLLLAFSSGSVLAVEEVAKCPEYSDLFPLTVSKEGLSFHRVLSPKGDGAFQKAEIIQNGLYCNYNVMGTTSATNISFYTRIDKKYKAGSCYFKGMAREENAECKHNDPNQCILMCDLR